MTDTPVRGWLYWAYEGLMAVAAILTLWLLTLPDGGWVEWAHRSIWALFAADYAVRLVRAPDRRRFVREHIPDLVAILPLDMLRVARLARLVRLIRAARALLMLLRVSRDLRGILGTNGLGYVLLVTAGLVILGGFAAWAVEPRIANLGNGIWWSIVTTTTVGYGDISPETVPGRILAVVLMFTGIGTVGMITGSIATYFLREQRAENPHVRHVMQHLSNWDGLSVEQKRQLLGILNALVEQEERNRTA